VSAFDGKLIAELIDDDESGIWQLQVALSFLSDLAGRTLTAPPGFKTDFCSVPRLPIA
jgi:hypothetical protein